MWSRPTALIRAVRLLSITAVTGNEKYSKIGNKTAAKTATTVQQNW